MRYIEKHCGNDWINDKAVCLQHVADYICAQLPTITVYASVRYPMMKNLCQRYQMTLTEPYQNMAWSTLSVIM
jgi:hypothetical protein